MFVFLLQMLRSILIQHCQILIKIHVSILLCDKIALAAFDSIRLNSKTNSEYVALQGLITFIMAPALMSSLSLVSQLSIRERENTSLLFNYREKILTFNVVIWH